MASEEQALITVGNPDNRPDTWKQKYKISNNIRGFLSMLKGENSSIYVKKHEISE